MDCEKARTLFSPYLDGELDPSEGALLAAHLRSCAECRREFSELTASLELLRSLPEMAPAGDFALGVRMRLAQSKAGRQHCAFTGSAASGGGRSGREKPGLRNRLARLLLAVNRRPIWLAAAAVLILAFGLAIYLSGGAVLRGGPELPEQLASAPLSAYTGPDEEKAGAVKNEREQSVFRDKKETAADASGKKAPGEEAGDHLLSKGGETSFERTLPLPGGSATATAKPAPAGSGSPAASAGQDARPETEEPKLFSASRENQPVQSLSVSSRKVARTVKIFLGRLDGRQLESFLEKYAPGQKVAKEPPLVIRVPVSQLPGLLAAAKSWEAVTGVQDDSRDLTEEYLRLEAALNEKQGKMETEGVKQEIEGLKQKMQAIEEQAGLATVEIFWPE